MAITRVVYGTHFDTLRDSLVQQNLETSKPNVQSIGDYEYQPASLWRRVSYSLQHDKRGWAELALRLVGVAAAVGLFVVGIKFSIGVYRALTKQAFDKIGKYFDYTYYRNGLVVGRDYFVLYTETDYQKDRIAAIFFALVAFTVSTGSAFILSVVATEGLPFPFSKPLNEYKITILHSGSSMSDFEPGDLANDKDPHTGGYLDPITLETIPLEKLASPSIFRIGKYAITIESLLEVIASRQTEGDGKIPHPLENRSMNPEEQAKFVEDFSHLFCCNAGEVLYCWQIDDYQWRNSAREIASEAYGTQWSSAHLFEMESCVTYLKQQGVSKTVQNRVLRLIPPSVRPQFSFLRSFQAELPSWEDIHALYQLQQAQQLLQELQAAFGNNPFRADPALFRELLWTVNPRFG